MDADAAHALAFVLGEQFLRPEEEMAAAATRTPFTHKDYESWRCCACCFCCPGRGRAARASARP